MRVRVGAGLNSNQSLYWTDDNYNETSPQTRWARINESEYSQNMNTLIMDTNIDME